MDVRSLAFVGASEVSYLAGVSDEGCTYYTQVPAKGESAQEPLFPGSMIDFVDANTNLEDQMRNTAKKCSHCGKSCATIMNFCNGCGADLSDAKAEYTENVCMGFVYGIGSWSRGPLCISMRLETPDLLVYDDLLARGSCHLNAIPSTCHLPDWRHLLRNPSKGRLLMQRLDDACWQVLREQFWENEAWRQSTLRAGAFATPEEFRSRIYAGVNAVPSQFQIHLQYIVPPIKPCDYYHLLHGRRLVKDRWLPLEYVMASLQALEDSGTILREAHTMSMESIFGAIAEAGGPDYNTAHAQALERYSATHQASANWQPDFFDFAVVIDAETSSTEVRPLRNEESAGTDLTAQALEKKDTVALQSYGRPYDAQGRPLARTYYCYAKEPGQVMSADEWVEAS